METKEKAREKLRNELKERNQNNWFVQHVRDHLTKDQEVCCKICGKFIDEVAEEKMQEIENKMKESWRPVAEEILKHQNGSIRAGGKNEKRI